MRASELIQHINRKKDFRYSSSEGSFQISSMKDNNGKVNGFEIITRIVDKCNYRCMYCGVGFKALSKKSFSNLINVLERSDLKGSRIVISGGEPTLSRYFVSAMHRLVKTNCTEIQVQTNAVRLSDPEFFDSLPHDDRIKLFISFPSHRRDHYEKITQSRSYEHAKEGLRKAATRYRIEICMVVNMINHMDICDNIVFIEDLIGASNFQFSISNVFVNQGIDGERFIVRYSSVKPNIEAAKDYSDRQRDIVLNAKDNGFDIPHNRRLRMPWSYAMTGEIKQAQISTDEFLFVSTPQSGECSFPFCVRPENLKIPPCDNVRSENTADMSYGSQDKKFFKALDCKSCAYDNICTGFQTEYVKRFGTSEIRPMRDNRP